ncbi:FtsX-like permease family protein [Leucobacter chromiireducens]|uniref:FtsX-like permease family protein n=1 Tax=Leucobacter chromiireducens subsp. solipictus TaxID=398235 RepID=A0ABS1SIM5_9MICO|nr:FtsX-like permease family protein [Leucobacter chromiireducens]MBL3679877.1 FtsX-like permease family protein [Leucobacter chromiireducens subsp. solipictus]
MIGRVLPLLSRPSRQGSAALLLPIIAFASVTLLLATVLGGAQTFWSYTDELAPLYWVCAVIALVLLIIPLLSLGHAAARLSARRRDDRLAVLRLLGMPARSTALLAVIEASALAFGGAVVGAALAYAAAPLVGLIQFRGEALGAAGVALPPLHALVVVLGVTAIAAVSAVLSLRRVIISPLGVALKQQAPKLPWVQAIFAVLAIAVAAGIVSVLNGFGSIGGIVAMIGAMGFAFGIALLALDLIGAWLLGVFGRAKARRAQRPADLLAARQILEGPRAAWRQVSGVAMSSFVAVFAGSGVALLAAVDPGDTGGAEAGEAFPVADIATGIIITVIGSFIMVACSVGVNQAAQILDRAEVIRSIDVMGAPLAMQDAARRKATLLPLLLASLGAAILAGVLVFPLLGMAIVLAPLSLAVILGSVAAGIGIVLLTLLATRPLLHTVAASAPRAAE